MSNIGDWTRLPTPCYLRNRRMPIGHYLGLDAWGFVSFVLVYDAVLELLPRSRPKLVIRHALEAKGQNVGLKDSPMLAAG